MSGAEEGDVVVRVEGAAGIIRLNRPKAINAVTLEMEAVLLAQHAELGGSLTRISVSRADAVGSMQAWRPAMPITQWVWSKP